MPRHSIRHVDLSARSKLNSPRNTGRPLAGESALTESAKTPLTRAGVSRTRVPITWRVYAVSVDMYTLMHVYHAILQIRGID